MFIYYGYLIRSSYDKGAHLFLPSYVMRIHGARQQREAVKRAPRKQLQEVFEVCQNFYAAGPPPLRQNKIKKERKRKGKKEKEVKRN